MRGKPRDTPDLRETGAKDMPAKQPVEQIEILPFARGRYELGNSLFNGADQWRVVHDGHCCLYDKTVLME